MKALKQGFLIPIHINSVSREDNYDLLKFHFLSYYQPNDEYGTCTVCYIKEHEQKLTNSKTKSVSSWKIKNSKKTENTLLIFDGLKRNSPQRLFPQILLVWHELWQLTRISFFFRSSIFPRVAGSLTFKTLGWSLKSYCSCLWICPRDLQIKACSRHFVINFRPCLYCLPANISNNLCFQFPLGISVVPRGLIKQRLCKILWGKQGVLCIQPKNPV